MWPPPQRNKGGTPPPWRTQAFDHEITRADLAEFGEAFKTGEPQHHMNAFLERKSKRS